jgi:transposase-like protein
MTSARRPVDPALRDQAVALAAEHGLAEAHRRTGQAKSSILGWARKAGVELSSERSTNRNRQAGLDSAARRRALVAQADEDAAGTLIPVRALALTKTLELLREGPGELRDYVGVWTRATHDLALLSGQATERLASEPVNVEVQVTVRNDLVGRLDAMARRMSPEAIDVAPVAASSESGGPAAGESTNGHNGAGRAS